MPRTRRQRRTKRGCLPAHRDDPAGTRYNIQSKTEERRLNACANDRYLAQLFGVREGTNRGVAGERYRVCRVTRRG